MNHGFEVGEVSYVRLSAVSADRQAVEVHVNIGTSMIFKWTWLIKVSGI
jgi:hypothetical protein